MVIKDWAAVERHPSVHFLFMVTKTVEPLLALENFSGKIIRSTLYE